MRGLWCATARNRSCFVECWYGVRLFGDVAAASHYGSTIIYAGAVPCLPSSLVFPVSRLCCVGRCCWCSCCCFVVVVVVVVGSAEQPCYNDLKDGEIIALAETAVRKADLKRKKNDEQAEVSNNAH